jgi:hypothetical protein
VRVLVRIRARSLAETVALSPPNVGFSTAPTSHGRGHEGQLRVDLSGSTAAARTAEIGANLPTL